VQATGRVDHDLTRGGDVADDRAADLYRARANRRLDGSGLGDDHRVRALDLAAEFALDAERLRGHQAPVHVDATLDDRDTRVRRAGLERRPGRRLVPLGVAEHQTPPARSFCLHLKSPRCREHFSGEAAAPRA
jgi:hypothetical protein